MIYSVVGCSVTNDFQQRKEYKVVEKIIALDFVVKNIFKVNEDYEKRNAYAGNMKFKKD